MNNNIDDIFVFLAKARARGLLVGPDESLAEFKKRVESSPPLHPPLDVAPYEIQPDWMKISYENRGLRLWEGGCSWILEGGVVLQLNKRFATREKIYGLYTKKELLSHESVHAARVKFSENRFEEILAYQTSESFFRRYVGPLFQTPKETLLLLLLASFSFFHLWLFLLFAAGISYFCLRLFRLYKTFANAKSHVDSLVQKPSLDLMLSLTDREIVFFARGKREESLAYIEKENSLRWQQIKSVFSFA